MKARRGKNADENTLASYIWAMLVKAGVFVKVRGAPQNDVNKYYYSISKHSFAGSDASKLVGLWRPLMDLLYPADLRSKDAKAALEYKNWCSCWGHWEVVWAAIQLETEDRASKAEKVAAEGSKFVDLWVSACGKATKHLYPHMLTCHLPSLIRDLPIDPMYLSLQSQEHRHSQRKRAAFRTNKKAPKDVSERAETVAPHLRSGAPVAGYLRNAGKCRTYKTFRIMLLQDELENIYETPQSKQIKYDRWRRQQARCEFV
jgi:hypothetical protein